MEGGEGFETQSQPAETEGGGGEVLQVEEGATGERIVAVGPDVEPTVDSEIVDAAGLLVLPGLVDAHVHLREPGGEHKEDITSGTHAALAGGVTTVLAMPNTAPPITDLSSLTGAVALADSKAVCDFGFFVGATPNNAAAAAALTTAAGLKMYMGSSTGSLLVDEIHSQYDHFTTYPPQRPIAVHAEDEAAVQWFARQGQRRPPLCAALETARALVLAEHLGRRPDRSGQQGREALLDDIVMASDTSSHQTRFLASTKRSGSSSRIAHARRSRCTSAARPSTCVACQTSSPSTCAGHDSSWLWR